MIETVGEILASRLPAPLVAKLKFKCPNCGRITEKGLFDVCFMCHRRMEFTAMPEEQKEIAISCVVPPRYMKARLSDLSENVADKIKKLSPNKGLFLWGAQGTGKTHTMCALIREYVAKGYLVERINYEMLCLKIRDTYKQQSKDTELSVIQPLLNADKLFIEDVGTTKSEDNIESDFSLRVFLIILDFRLEQLLPTFITSNRPIEELKRTFDARIASRLIEACEIIQYKGKDKRIINEEAVSVRQNVK